MPSTGITGNYPASPPDWPAPTYPPVEIPVVPPAPGPGDMVGKGNLFYVSSLKGVAKCTGAYGTNGTDGTPIWTAINTGLVGDALKIRFMDLDPFSVSGDHFTAMWAMTDDGLYRCTGLPDAATWAQQLTVTAAAALVGKPAGECAIAYYFTPSVRKAGFIAAILEWKSGTSSEWYTVYSLDYGATWNGDSTYWVSDTPDFGSGSIVLGMMLHASFHLDDVYYMIGPSGFRHTSDHAGEVSPLPSIMRSPGYYGGSLPHLSEGMTANALSDVGRMYAPYCNSSGTIFANDDRLYLFKIPGASGTGQIIRFTDAFTPLWSPGYAARVSTSVGDAAMPAIDWLFSNMFNEDYGIAIDASNIWFTPNLTASPPTWTRKNLPVIGGRAFSARYQYCVPCDVNIALFTGKTTTGGEGIAQVALTPNFGTNFYDVTNHGGANDLDTVLSLVAGDMDNSIIQLDYFKP